MKTSLLTICLFFFTSLSLFAQTNVTLNIHHKLGNADFAMETEVVNNIGNNFDFTRLEYYIAEISLIHDGGQETIVDDLYILVDANEAAAQALGQLAVTDVEAIKFYVGVDQGNNHADPTSFGNGHPLSPQLPSMHWGWAAGYRFGAFEGNSGTNMNQAWEIHALEDENYFQTEIALELTADNGELVIDLDADYIRSMENIQLNNGPITHGGYDEAITTLRNFQDHVFTASNLVSNNEEVLAIHNIRLYPNPTTTTKQSSLYITTDTEEQYQIIVTNAQGQLLKQLNQVNSNTEVDLMLSTAGVYFVSLQQNGKTLKTERLIVQ